MESLRSFGSVGMTFLEWGFLLMGGASFIAWRHSGSGDLAMFRRMSSGLLTIQGGREEGSGGVFTVCVVHFCDLCFCISCISDEEGRGEIEVICTGGFSFWRYFEDWKGDLWRCIYRSDRVLGLMRMLCG
jgi:hypothetical protein